MTTELDRTHTEIKHCDKVMAKDIILRELLYVKPDNFWHGYGRLQDTAVDQYRNITGIKADWKTAFKYFFLRRR